MAMSRKPRVTMTVAEARAILERIQEETAAADPLQPAPPAWMSEMQHALRAVTTRETVQRYRLDGLQGINMAYLHRRVATVLQDFDQLVADEPEKRRRVSR